MAGLEDLLSKLPLDQIAAQLGVDVPTAKAATEQALPTLLEGLKANAADPQGAASLQSALQQHENDLLDGGVDLNQVDAADGEKIVSNIFGDNKEAVVSQLAAAPAPADQPNPIGGLVAKLLPTLAPIALSFIANQMKGAGQAQAPQAAAPAAPAGGLDIGGLLGGLLGGGGQQAAPQAGGGLDIGGLLGGLLGGGKR